jgi:DNA-binding phage protein
LHDAGEAEKYLNAALEEGNPELFLLALRNVAEAQGGVAQLAEKAKLNRKSFTKYSPNGAILNSKASTHSSTR